MTTNATRPVIGSLCEEALATDAAARILVFANDAWADAQLQNLARDRIVLRNRPDPDTQEADGCRYSLAVVDTGAESFCDPVLLTRTLASLRDRFARRVLVSDEGQVLALQDYLALGFERLKDAPGKALYLLDPDADSRQREWNNARDWANPENFERYRW